VSPDSVPAHHPLDPLAADGMARGAQFGLDARRAIASPVVGMNPPDIDRQLAIGDFARALWPGPLAVIAKRRPDGDTLSASHMTRTGQTPRGPSVVLDQADLIPALPRRSPQLFY
jgi:hypothetical protein